MLDKMQGVDNDIDELDAGERGDEAAQAVDQEVAPEQGRRAQGPEAHAPEGQGDRGR